MTTAVSFGVSATAN